MGLFNFQPPKYELVTDIEKRDIRKLAGKLINQPSSKILFNDLHDYCLDILDRKGLDSWFLFWKATKYNSLNKDIKFGIDIQYRRRIRIDSLMLAYTQDENIVNSLHLMRKREKVKDFNPSKSFFENYDFINPGILRISGTDKNYRIIRYVN